MTIEERRVSAVGHSPAERSGSAKGALPWSPRMLNALLVAVALVVNVGGVLLVSRHFGDDLVFPGPGDTALLVIGPALLWWRSRFPTWVLFGCAAAVWTFVLTSSNDGPVYLPMIIALVSAITRRARVAAYLLAGGTIGVRLVALALPDIDAPSLTSTTRLTAWLLFLLALGEVLRYRQALAESRQQRLLANLDAQADQIRREAAEQRLGLARDLHDVLGHQLTVINIQAKAGLQLHRSGKPGVEAAFDAVQEASSQALIDVQAFLDSLRDPDDQAAHIPSPTLANLDDLLAPARAAGLDVELDVIGTPRRLPALRISSRAGRSWSL
ncbi:MAG: sensor histidine kinase [Nocardioides sp.]